MILDEHRLRMMWKVRPSKVEGYFRNYRTVTPEGDEIELDFNFPRQMVRILLRIAGENGREYVAVIKSGTILQERDAVTRRSMDLFSKLYPYRNYFNYLPDEPLLKALGGSYGLPLEPVAWKGFEVPTFRLPSLRSLNLFERIGRYLRRKREEELNRPPVRRFLRRIPDEMLDLSLGSLLLLAYLQNLINLTQFAGFVGFLGIMTGALDWVWRQRNPFLPKVILLLASSAGAVYYQIQNRVWGIFL